MRAIYRLPQAMSPIFPTEASPAAAPPSRPRSATILIVDDDEGCRRGLRALLERQQHVVREAPDGKAALAALREGLPDLMFLDMMMPGADGLEVLMEMRQRGVRVPVVGMSGGNLAPAATLRIS